MWATTTLRNAQCCVCQHPRFYPVAEQKALLRLQMNKVRNRPKIAATGLTDDSPAVPGWNLAFPFAFRA